MTFKSFEMAAKKYAGVYKVYRHGDFGFGAGHEKDEQSVAVVFSEGGKVYRYFGSYQDILNKLGVKCLDKARAEVLKSRLEMLKLEHGKIDEFGFDEEVIDNSKEIALIETKLAESIII